MSLAPSAASAPSALTPKPPAPSRIHPVIHAGKWLAADLLSTLVFVGLYALFHSLSLAIVLGIVAGVGQVAWLRWRRAPIDAMQGMSLALVVVFGGASLLTRDPRFVMLKPTLIYAAIGAVMLKRGWMSRYMPPEASQAAPDLANLFGYVWAGLMFLTGAVNLGFVAHGDPKLWAWFIGVAPLTSKLLLFAIQYAVTRTVVRQRLAAAPAAA
ncbi:MAG: septation protein IspZ [Alphaproteobacteria bacterium]|nr:septation protein IspZ [Alphaproteobacteria bacterium]